MRLGTMHFSLVYNNYLALMQKRYDEILHKLSLKSPIYQEILLIHLIVDSQTDHFYHKIRYEIGLRLDYQAN